MSEPLFVSQQKLESWLDAGTVTFENDTLTLLSEHRSYKLAPAVRITDLLDGQDVHGWLGKIVGAAELASRGAEHVQGSVIVGDTAYMCEDGYVGAQMGSEQPAPPAAAPNAPQSAGPASDADLLSDFLLKNL